MSDVIFILRQITAPTLAKHDFSPREELLPQDRFKKASVTGRGRLRPRKAVSYWGHTGTKPSPPHLVKNALDLED